MRHAWSILALLVYVACGGADPEPRPEPEPEPDDTGAQAWEGDTSIAEIPAPGCRDGKVRLAARTRGWTDGQGLVNLWHHTAAEGQRWNEEHDLPSVARGELGWWDELLVELEPGVDGAERNVASHFSCEGDALPEGLVYAFRVYDAQGALADCALLQVGAPGGVEAVLAGDTDEAVFTPVTRREEISAGRCRVWAP